MNLADILIFIKSCRFHTKISQVLLIFAPLRKTAPKGYLFLLLCPGRTRSKPFPHTKKSKESNNQHMKVQGEGDDQRAILKVIISCHQKKQKIKDTLHKIETTPQK